VWWHLDKNSVNIVDVGCGEGIPAKFLRRHRHAFMLGLDIFLPSILTARKNGCHDQYIQADVRYLPIAEKSFDVVMSMEVLEHLDRQEGLDFLQALERIARRQVIVTTPGGKHEQNTLDQNPHQLHKYIWESLNIGHYRRSHRALSLNRADHDRFSVRTTTTLARLLATDVCLVNLDLTRKFARRFLALCQGIITKNLIFRLKCRFSLTFP